jgi:hypothetical protein
MRLHGHVRTMMGSTLSALLLVFGLMAGAATQVKAQEPKKQEVRFDASVPRERQIKLALSSAPAEVSSKATLYVLGPKGYGFSCLVGRSFEGTTEASIDPMCYDAEGSRTLLLVKMREEELRAKGKSEAEIKADIANGYKEGRFQAPGKPGFVYMLSSENYIRDPETGKSGAFPGHLMFYAPYMTAKDLGYESVSGAMMPYLSLPGEPDAMMIVIPAPSEVEDRSDGDSHKH